jgi:hypothetical protein
MLHWGCQNRPSTGQSPLEGRLTRVLPYGTIHPVYLQIGARRSLWMRPGMHRRHRLASQLNEQSPGAFGMTPW